MILNAAKSNSYSARAFSAFVTQSQQGCYQQHRLLHGNHHHNPRIWSHQVANGGSKKNRDQIRQFASVSPEEVSRVDTAVPPLSSGKSSLACHFSASPYALPPGDDIITDPKPGQRIVAFGDVHGDLNGLSEFLVTAQIMDPNSTPEDPKWIGGDTICVQCGDVLDRGDDELACFRLLSSLSRQARKSGGALYLLYGNHESLNMAGLFQYANKGGNMEFERDIGSAVDQNMGNSKWRLQYAGNQPGRWAAFEPGGLLANDLLSNMKVAVVVGRTLFVHAGLTAQHLRSYGGIEGMNRSARDWIVKAQHDEHNNEGNYQTVEEIINSAQTRANAISNFMPDCLGGGTNDCPSPVWMRDYSQPSDAEPSNPKAQIMIDEALEVLGHGVERMVMGHTPQSQINSALDGKAWRVDVGASKGVLDGTPEVLEIIHGETQDTLTILTKSGKRIDAINRRSEMSFY